MNFQRRHFLFFYLACIQHDDEIDFRFSFFSFTHLRSFDIIIHVNQLFSKTSSPEPCKIAPRKFPFAHIRHATDPSFPLPLLPGEVVCPTHELNAPTTAAASSRGTRIHSNWRDDGDDKLSILRMSMDIDVPNSPRNWESAAVRYVRAVSGSRVSLSFCGCGWDILYFIRLAASIEGSEWREKSTVRV